MSGAIRILTTFGVLLPCLNLYAKPNPHSSGDPAIMVTSQENHAVTILDIASLDADGLVR
jgi:hypothetical protein